MTVFVDASALIAIIAAEPDAEILADILQGEPSRLCSALSVWETIAGLCRSYRLAVPEARVQVQAFLDVGAISYVAMGERELGIATDAYARYGKGRHRAALNMGDCFAYACAQAYDAKLLFKGDDFSLTDVAVATSA